MPTLLMLEARDYTTLEEGCNGDYFFLFDNQVDYTKAKREPRRRRLFRRFSHRHSSKVDWRRRRMLPYGEYKSSNTPETTALMSEDEHSLMHSHQDEHEEENNDDQSLSDRNTNIIWPETMSLVGDPSPLASTDNAKTKILMKKWKSRMGKSLRKVLRNKTDRTLPVGSVEEEDDEGDGDDEASKGSNLSFLEQAKRKLVVSMWNRSQRAKEALYEEEVGLYVYPDDDDVETVYRSTFEELCVPRTPEYKHLAYERRDQPPFFPEKVSLDNGYGVVRLLSQGNTNLLVSYDSDCAQLELQSDDEHSLCDGNDDISFTEDRMLPMSPQSSGEETEYNLFAQSSAEDDNDRPFCGRHQSLLAQSSTVSEDPSLFDNNGIGALCSAYPLPLMKVQQKAVLDKYSEDLTLFLQESTSTTEMYLHPDPTFSEDFSETSRRLGANGCHPTAKDRMLTSFKSSSSSEDERRLGISCAPVQMVQTTLEDAADVWRRIYAPPEENLPSPTPVQKQKSPWGCGLDASPLSVKSDITESEVGAENSNPFYNIRRYTSCGVVQEEDHPFDEVDSDKCVPRRQPPVRTAFFGCGVPEKVRSNLQHQDRLSRPRCECVKCSAANIYSNLLSKNELKK